MKDVRPSLEKQLAPSEIASCCPECGWPGMGNLPAGVSLVKQGDRTILVGNLSYFRIKTDLCSLCQEMESAVASRRWFVEAHAEYLDHIQGHNGDVDRR